MGLSKKNLNDDRDLRQRVGHDATSNFESDPKFSSNIPTANAGSENLSIDTEHEGDKDDDVNGLLGDETLTGEAVMDDSVSDRSLQDKSRNAGKHKSRRRAA